MCQLVSVGSESSVQACSDKCDGKRNTEGKKLSEGISDQPHVSCSLSRCTGCVTESPMVCLEGFCWRSSQTTSVCPEEMPACSLSFVYGSAVPRRLVSSEGAGISGRDVLLGSDCLWINWQCGLRELHGQSGE